MKDPEVVSSTGNAEKSDPYIVATDRKTSFTSWLIDAIGVCEIKPLLVDCDDETGSLQEIFLYMVSGRLDKAVEHALRTCKYMVVCVFVGLSFFLYVCACSAQNSS